MVARQLSRGVLGVLAAGLQMLGCSMAPGNAETDRMVDVVSTAIVYPHQDSAIDLARAASQTAATVISAEDLDAETLEDPRARLGLRFHVPGYEGKFHKVEPVTACYLVEFNHYEATSTERIRCPVMETELQIPPPPPQVRIPDGMDEILDEVLATLPARPADEHVRSTVADRMPAPSRDPYTGQRSLLPAVEVEVAGRDVGVALFEPETRSCLLGARVGADVLVWRPVDVYMQPGEYTCDPATALAREAMGSPH